MRLAPPSKKLMKNKVSAQRFELWLQRPQRWILTTRRSRHPDKLKKLFSINLFFIINYY